MRMGFIVNPIAGMGGKVGLKGTDNVLKEALARGAEPIAPERATDFLRRLKRDMEETQVKILACPRTMGQTETQNAGFPAQILPMQVGEETTAEDTKLAVRLLLKTNVDLIVFVGGDGTAKDILDAMNTNCSTLVLGVPAGVKMYSGIFAISPAAAADVTVAYARGQADTIESEVMDADETAIRSDTFSVKLYGYMRAPFVALQLQGSKEVSPDNADEKENQEAIARFVIENMESNAIYILGPGTTVKRIADLLQIKKTLLGVDIYRKSQVTLDVDEEQILNEIGDDWQNTWIILSPIGHQGILLGRGNQQISPQIIKRVGRERILVVATKNKLQSIAGNILRVDTGDAQTDEMLRGYGRVVTDYREWRLVHIE
jgi:predicted polyphosphate/ATP-dependent NAD kinase